MASASKQTHILLFPFLLIFTQLSSFSSHFIPSLHILHIYQRRLFSIFKSLPCLFLSHVHNMVSILYWLGFLHVWLVILHYCSYTLNVKFSVSFHLNLWLFFSSPSQLLFVSTFSRPTRFHFWLTTYFLLFTNRLNFPTSLITSGHTFNFACNQHQPYLQLF